MSENGLCLLFWQLAQSCKLPRFLKRSWRAARIRSVTSNARFPCPICGCLRQNHNVCCPECEWRKAREVAPRKRCQFDIPATFYFVTIVAVVCFVARVPISIVQNLGWQGAALLLGGLGLIFCLYIDIYLWWKRYSIRIPVPMRWRLVANSALAAKCSIRAESPEGAVAAQDLVN